jgi:hypothetical protein
MSQHLILNIIPFKPPVTDLECSLYTERQEIYAPIHKGDLKGLVEKVIPADKIHHTGWLYTNFLPPQNGDVSVKVNLTKSVYFANHYYRFLIRNYFKKLADVVYPNFTNDIEVWFQDKSFVDDKFKLYKIYTLKIQYARVTDGPELVLSYDGTTKILNKTLADDEFTDFDYDKLKWINCDGELYRYKVMPPHLKQDLSKLSPVVNNPIKPLFDISPDIPVFDNRYPKHLKELRYFYDTYLNKDEFKSIIPISPSGFFSLNNKDTHRTKMDSNELLFANGTSINPIDGMKNYGPYKASPHNLVKFFFIYPEKEKEKSVKKFYEYLVNGYYKQGNDGKSYKTFPDLKTYIKQPFQFEKEASISFKSGDNIVEEVRAALSAKNLDPNSRYIALYISPISKNETDLSKLIVYYHIKELLIQRGITSQVLDKEKIYDKNFNFFLPNIEIALLAKLDGIPWRLNRSTTNELIVGIGASYSVSRKTKFVGSAFCFNNEGIFEGFNCYSSDDTLMLAGSIRKAVLKYLVDHDKAKRLIIHFYKTISQEELQPIIDTLHHLGLPIPVIVITINKTESKELLAFDLNSRDLMPLSGTMIQVGSREYLLFNNTRYYEDSTPKLRDFHFPIKLSFASSKPELLDNVGLIKELLDQVYQFSRMYWKSVSQQNLPVTIKYPEMVAEIYPFFQHDNLSDFGQRNLWFL